MSKILKDKSEIIAWLKKYKVENYTLVEDIQYGFLVNVSGGVDLYDQKLRHILIQFGSVNGYFDCSHNQLTSLEGSPPSVGGDFYCDNNHLSSLEGSPKSIGGHFYCYDNQLSSLEGGPESVGGGFDCDSNIDLGKYQEITDFKIIRAKITSDNEKRLLSNLLDKSHLTSSVIKL